MTRESFPSSPPETPDEHGTEGDDRNRTGEAFPSSQGEQFSPQQMVEGLRSASTVGYNLLDSWELGATIRRVERTGDWDVFDRIGEIAADGREFVAIVAALLDDLWDSRGEFSRNLKHVDQLRATEKKLAAEKERTRERHITPAMRQQVLDRDGHKCVLCGTPDDLHMDHIVPFSQGGSCHVDNLQTLCREHNLAKAARFLDLRGVADAGRRRAA